jgi:secondary thiamine-phosphate synthase enzyme
LRLLENLLIFPFPLSHKPKKNLGGIDLKAVEVSIRSNEKCEFIDITERVNDLISIEEGFCIVYCPHTTAGLAINEGADPAVKVDIIEALDRLVPDNLGYRHLEGNSPSHIKASLVGNSLNILVERGTLRLGTWESIYFCEFDGPRSRRIFLKFIEG